jgi:catechol 2,3-dioxygenase-like lactoylglutathione lyase family enzyme
VQVTGLSWLGTRTSSYEEMVEFAQRVLGLPPPQGEPGLAVFELPDGSLFEIFAPDHEGGGHPDGVVAGFRVDDVAAARKELAAAGAEVTPLEGGSRDAWAYFRAPDGNLYEIVGPR